MPAYICIRNIDSSPGNPLISYPVYCGGYRSAADCIPRERDLNQEARSRDATRPICVPCQDQWAGYLRTLYSRREHLYGWPYHRPRQGASPIFPVRWEVWGARGGSLRVT